MIYRARTKNVTPHPTEEQKSGTYIEAKIRDIEGRRLGFVEMLAQLDKKFKETVAFYRTQRANLEAEIVKCDEEYSRTVPNCIKSEAIKIDGLRVFHNVNGEDVKCTRCNNPSMKPL